MKGRQLQSSERLRGVYWLACYSSYASSAAISFPNQR